MTLAVVLIALAAAAVLGLRLAHRRYVRRHSGHAPSSVTIYDPYTGKSQTVAVKGVTNGALLLDSLEGIYGTETVITLGPDAQERYLTPKGWHPVVELRDLCQSMGWTYAYQRGRARRAMNDLRWWLRRRMRRRATAADAAEFVQYLRRETWKARARSERGEAGDA